jgi:hypothetical protein
MKKFYLLILGVVLYNLCFSAPNITAITDGYWNSASTWNLNRLPQEGDTITIPSSRKVTIDDDENLNGFVFLKIGGKLTFQNNNSTLNLGSQAVIMILSGGQISGGGSASQKIRLDGDAIFKGNDAPVFGPQLASATSNGFAPLAGTVILPVKFAGFTATRKNSDVLLQWSTSEEVNANLYQVQRSEDGNNWKGIAYVTAMGNSSTLNSYSFVDKNVSSKLAYYRIKEVDVDGKAIYTSVQFIKFETVAASDIKIAATGAKVVLQFPSQVKGSLVVRFVSKNGQVVDQQSISNPIGQVVLNSKFTGNYIISISNGNDINTAKQVLL